MLISVVIPIYNAEKYLERCLDAVLTAMNGIKGEVILVDNLSSDNSFNISKKYQKLYPGIIKIFSCKTPGAAATRNFGLQKAQGEYVWFVDADDYIANDSITKILAVVKQTNADLIMIGAKKILKNGSQLYLSAVRKSEKNYKGRFVRYGMGPWQVVFKRTWWERHGFSFREKIIHEDMELMSALILYTDNFVGIDEPLYIYCENIGSVLHKEKWDEHYFDIFPALEGLHGRFSEAGSEKKYHDDLEWFFIWNLLIDSAQDFTKFKEGKPGFAKSRQMLKEFFPAWRENKYLKQKSWKTRLKVRINYWK